MSKPVELGRFRRRVRAVRFWQGIAVGALLGAGLAAVLVAGLRLEGRTVPWWITAGVVVGLTVLIAVVSASRRLTDFALADSVDRRADLKNRVGSALEISAEAEWQGLVNEDATAHLAALNPKKLYPVRFGRAHLAALIGLVLISGVALLGNRPIKLTEVERAKRAQAEELANNIEHVLQPYAARKLDPKAAKEQMKRVAEMRQLAKDLHSMKLDPEQALQKMHQIAAEAKELENQQAQQIKAELTSAEMAQAQATKDAQNETDPMGPLARELKAESDKLQAKIDELKAKLTQAGGKEAEDLKSELASLEKQKLAADKAAADVAKSDADSDSGSASHEKALGDALKLETMPGDGGGADPLAAFKQLKLSLMATTQAEIAEIKERLKTAKGAEAERLRKKLAALEAQYAQVKAEVEAANAAIRAAIKNLKQGTHKAGEKPPSSPSLKTKFSPTMRKALTSLQAALKKLESGDDLSEKEVEDLRDIADKMQAEAEHAEDQGDKERSLTATVLAQAASELADQAAAVLLSQSGSGAGGASGAQVYANSHQAGPGGYMPTSSEHNSGVVNHLDKQAKSLGKTHESVVDPLEGNGPESYVEVRGPANLGKRSAVPYQTVLPSYRRKAESALDHGEIPKKHQKRVRAYFELLTGK